jgi:hypothetical protein
MLRRAGFDAFGILEAVQVARSIVVTSASGVAGVAGRCCCDHRVEPVRGAVVCIGKVRVGKVRVELAKRQASTLNVANAGAEPPPPPSPSPTRAL